MEGHRGQQGAHQGQPQGASDLAGAVGACPVAAGHQQALRRAGGAWWLPQRAYSLGDRDGGQTCIMASGYVFFKTFPRNTQGFMVTQVDGLEVVFDTEAFGGFLGLALEHFTEMMFAGNVLTG